MLKKHLLRPERLVVARIVVVTTIVFAIIEEQITLRIVVIIHKHRLQERRLVDQGVVLAKV
jgi:hypothetical protein